MSVMFLPLHELKAFGAFNSAQNWSILTAHFILPLKWPFFRLKRLMPLMPASLISIVNLLDCEEVVCFCTICLINHVFGLQGKETSEPDYEVSSTSCTTPPQILDHRCAGHVWSFH